MCCCFFIGAALLLGAAIALGLQDVVALMPAKVTDPDLQTLPFSVLALGVTTSVAAMPRPPSPTPLFPPPPPSPSPTLPLHQPFCFLFAACSPPPPPSLQPPPTLLRPPLPPPPTPPWPELPPVLPWASVSTEITIVSLEGAGPPVPANFIGLSIEVWSASAYLNSKVTNLLGALRSLSSGPQPGPVLRLGGNSADASCFVDGDTKMPAGCSYRITQAHLAEYLAFARRDDLNLSFVLDVNFGRSASPELAAAHVAAIGRAGLWPFVRAIELGNEEDHYAKPSVQEQQAKGHRGMDYHYLTYEREFASYLTALHDAGLPPHRVQGGTWCCSLGAGKDRGGFVGNLSRYTHRFASDLVSFSYHRYPTSHCGGARVTAAELLGDASSSGQAEHLAPLMLRTASDVEFVVGEGNSVACGGFAGVSDTFAAALWALDLLSELSKRGVRLFNFHCGPDILYTPIGFGANGALQVRPLFYGMRLFAELTANGSVWLDSRERSTGHRQASPYADPQCARGLLASGSPSCCPTACGACGGMGCEARPGGEQACCTRAIEGSGQMCQDRGAPCVLDPGFQRSPVAQHAVLDSQGVLRVLVIARSITEGAAGGNMRQTSVCMPKTDELPRNAELVRLTAPTLGSTFDTSITLGGQTWNASTDGLPGGQRQTERLLGVLRASQECFRFALPPLSAAMLVVPPPPSPTPPPGPAPPPPPPWLPWLGARARFSSI